MANYYLDYVGLNTFIYEPCGWDFFQLAAANLSERNHYTDLISETKLNHLGLLNLSNGASNSTIYSTFLSSLRYTSSSGISSIALK